MGFLAYVLKRLVLLGLVLPLAIGVANVYNVTGTWFTFALAFVYVVSNIGLFVFYRREHRDEFSWGKHLLIPAIEIIALAVAVYPPSLVRLQNGRAIRDTRHV